MKNLLFPLLLILSSCSLYKGQNAYQYRPIILENPTIAKPIIFSDIKFSISPDEKIGVARYDLMCAMYNNWNFGDTKYTTFRKEEFERAFADEIKKHNYQIANDPDLVFTEELKKDAEFKVGAVVKGIKTDMCHSKTWDKTYYKLNELKGKPVSGNAAIEVKWYVYSIKEKKIVYEKITKGKAAIENAQQIHPLNIVLEAFANAVEGLLSEEKFYNTITKK